jgi:hypothetical protein
LDEFVDWIWANGKDKDLSIEEKKVIEFMKYVL